MGEEGTEVSNARDSRWITEGMGGESSISELFKVLRTIGDVSNAICH